MVGLGIGVGVSGLFSDDDVADALRLSSFVCARFTSVPVASS